MYVYIRILLVFFFASSSRYFELYKCFDVHGAGHDRPIPYDQFLDVGTRLLGDWGVEFEDDGVGDGVNGLDGRAIFTALDMEQRGPGVGMVRREETR